MERREERQAGLKKFISEYSGNQTVETRVMLVFSFSVLVQLMFFNQSEETSVTYGSLVFALLCVLVVVFNAWMDYFPSRLSRGVQLRTTTGQGLSLGCLLLPTLATALLHNALLTQPSLTSLSFLYMCVLALLSVATVLATLFSVVPYPNSIVVYLFAIIGLSYGAQSWLGTPMVVSLPALLLYSALVPFCVSTFPKSFTLAEIVILMQALVLLLIDVLLHVLLMGRIMRLPVVYQRSVPLLYVEFLLAGVFLCCVLLSPLLYQVLNVSQSMYHKLWSTLFILSSLTIGLVLVLPALGLLVAAHPISLVLHLVTSSTTRLLLTGYWMLVSIATGVLVWAQSQEASRFKSTDPSSVWLRKCFHGCALLVFVPGLLLDAEFLSFATSLAAFLFIVAELVRVVRMWPFGRNLSVLLAPMCGEREQGPLVLSHIYLLLGLSVPLWISPSSTGVKKLCLYSGVLCVGVGDAMAALAGTLLGKHKWPGTSKTIEGTLMSVLTQLCVLVLLTLIDPQISSIGLTQTQWLSACGGIVLTSLLEAYTWQIDNLILSICLCFTFVTFL